MNLTVKFRNRDEAARCDLTRLGNVAGASEDGLSVRVEDVDFAEWRPYLTTRVPVPDAQMDALGAIRAAMAACGVWAEVHPE